MSGHSKWSNIKHRKEKSDAQKGKIFTKMGREIAITVRQGGPDPAVNSKLKDVIAKAKANNMPNDTIERSIKKASGELGGANYEEIVYEGYGPSGVAVIVETATDNKNRTAGEMRHFFDKYGGNLGTSGCVSFMFDKKGVIIVEKADDIDEDELMMEALEAGAEDMAVEEDFYEINTAPDDFHKVYSVLEEKGYTFASAGVEMVPQTTTVLEIEDDIKKMNKLIELLEDFDDVQNVYHNWDMPEDRE
ncbi:YebC/PmpR family DNA-binding transcriptional regulator [Petroclostridium sp. X23]|uniref:YebC/PmpR family DNA-binding transcriptional regulator n=1 Tax=Petroclostridium sp. X23 TaxID=3045146 RepID=UPI0024ADD941|nr:YebC/PmpR family DNA-binding transcriptional regulator [Petroclostridium sp. X23]WHH59237.1 YebC/PmpR family DNA-binding transcriptional regulator [Petroclostridium sp. X23]